MRRVWRHKEFDPTAEYVVSKPLLFGSRRYARGELFDAKTTQRQKRLLYDARFLRLAPENVDQKLPANGDLLLNEQEVEELNALMELHEETQNHTGVAIPDETMEPAPKIEPVKPARRIALAGRGWYRIEIGPKGCGNFLSDKKVRLKEAEKLLAE